eukprot:TRINITY_DN1039_c0_g1_i16.p1 TRINITY_DN1039_c0_g1~~TRINITY_DN1039_c0_g1_i16.p1  ORF type:complete len:271 (+),score=53.90 TRINITY_DN1039_c0_g1_i16:459-1271(+)
MHIAVTSMFAEYAVLYARIAGHTTSAVPPTMTLTEGRAIADDAKNFANNYVTPILGHIASVKVHKLLSHVADAVKWHDSIQNGNSAANQCEHKIDKPFYARTNKDARTFTRQLIRHAHGARGILARHAKEHKDAMVVWKAKLAEKAAAEAAAAAAATPRAPTDAAGGGCGEAPGDSASAAVPDAAVAAEAERVRKQKRRVLNVGHMAVGDLAQLPDLASVGALLNMAAERHVRITTRTPIDALFDCSTLVKQQLRAADDYLCAPWNDAVL